MDQHLTFQQFVDQLGQAAGLAVSNFNEAARRSFIAACRQMPLTDDPRFFEGLALGAVGALLVAWLVATVVWARKDYLRGEIDRREL